jgi:hypothetical protein
LDTASLGTAPLDPAVSGGPDGPVGDDHASIGVPSIPTTADPARPPAAVPSVPVPVPADLFPLSPVRAAPGPPTEPVSATVPTAPPGMAAELTGFPSEVVDKLRSYVYLLVDPRSGRAFCLSRGRGDRCFRHVQAARTGADRQPGRSADAVSKFPMLDRIRQIESDGRPVRIDILRYGLSGAEASLVEVAVGDALGLPVGSELPRQRHPATDSGVRLAKKAKIKGGHQAVLLRLGGTTADPAYESARHGWRIGKRWIDPDSPRSPRLAVFVVGDLVTAVYRIERWEPTPSEAGRSGPHPGAATSTGRYSLVGVVDPELERRYRGRTVAAYLGGGSPSRVTYVRCGPHWVNTAS